MAAGFDAPLLWQIIIGLIIAGAVYGGIRSDIKSMHEHIRRVERAADRAHARLDSFGCNSNNVKGRRTSDDDL